jgi:ubiquitin carboxyl-terminal hydrolase L3
MNTSVNWPALESDPEIFTKYAQSLGLKGTHTFNEIFSLDEEMLSMCQGSAVILCFNYNKNGPERKLEESNFVEANSLPYYMKQSGSLDLACGVIALLHSIGNSQVELVDGSILKNYFEKTKSMTPEERSSYLETCQQFKQAHLEFANQGQSNQVNAEECSYHFIAFVHYNGKLYELDGLKKGPYVVNESVQDTNIVPLVGAEINKQLEQGIISENFALMFLA